MPSKSKRGPSRPPKSKALTIVEQPPAPKPAEDNQPAVMALLSNASGRAQTSQSWLRSSQSKDTIIGLAQIGEAIVCLEAAQRLIQARLK